MKVQKRITRIFILILFIISNSTILFAQRGDEKKQTLSLDRNHYAFNGDKTGFNFTGLGLGYQFANCGGDVQLGINYNKNVNFTTFSYNEKNVGATEVGSELWPKSNEIEVQEIEASLYFGTQNLGKVNLNYIVGNFSGCFGETFDVLAQVGQDPKAKQYKDQINDLTLRNITIIRADAIGDNRKNKIIEKLKTKDTDAEVLRLFKAADVESSLGNYETARAYYQDANRLKYSPETQNRINEMNRLISEHKAKEKETANSTPPTSSASSGTSNTTSKPSNAVKKETGNKEEKEKEKTTETNEKEDTYIDRSARNELRQNLGLNNTYNNTNQNNNVLVNQGYAINQQSKRTEQAIDNAASQVNSIFQNNIDRINREKAERDAQEDDSYENSALYISDQKYLKEKKAEEDYKKQRDEDAKNYKLSKEQAYQAKGGITNYNAELINFKQYASESIGFINGYLTKHNGNSILLDPIDNCSYVKAIVDIQKISSIAIPDKDILINRILLIRDEYRTFYIENSLNGLEEYTDDLGIKSPECGNYLDAIVMRSSGFRRESYAMSYNKFGAKSTTTSFDNYGILSKNNHTRTRGIGYYSAEDFETELKNIGIVMPSKYLSYLLQGDKISYDFHNRYTDNLQPAYFKWSDGSFNYANKKGPIFGKDVRKEIELYRKYYKLKKDYFLTSGFDSFYMSLFNYHSGYIPDAFDLYNEYVLLVHGSFQNLIDNINTAQFKYDGPNIKEVSLLGAMLYKEDKEYDKAMQIINAFENYLKKKKPNFYERMLWATYKIKTLTYYNKGEYNKITFPNIKNSKDFVKYREEISNDLYPILANSLIKTGDLKKAKMFISNDYKSRKKGNNYYGTKTDIEAYKEVIKELYPNDKTVIQFVEQPAYLIIQDFEYLFLRPVKGLYYPSSKIPTTIIDLEQNATWKEINNKLSYDKREQLSDAYSTLLSIYKSGKLKNNLESELFLKTLVQYGMVLGNYNEVMPAMLQLKESKNTDKRLMVQEKLITQMISNQIGWSDTISKWFLNNMSDPEIKEIVRTYLYDWSYFGTTSPHIPYLYSFY